MCSEREEGLAGKAGPSEREAQEAGLFEEMKSAKVVIDELIPKLERFSYASDAAPETLESYANMLDAAIRRFSEAEQKWIDVVNKRLKSKEIEE